MKMFNGFYSKWIHPAYIYWIMDIIFTFGSWSLYITLCSEMNFILQYRFLIGQFGEIICYWSLRTNSKWTFMVSEPVDVYQHMFITMQVQIKKITLNDINTHIPVISLSITIYNDDYNDNQHDYPAASAGCYWDYREFLCRRLGSENN